MPNAIERLFESVTSKLQPNRFAPWSHSQALDVDDADIVFPEDDSNFVLSAANDDDVDAVSRRLLQADQYSPPLPEEAAVLGGAIRERGLEAFAFYKSWRFRKRAPFRGRWGIFYLKDAIHYVRWLMESEYPGRADMRAMAKQFLFEHEHHHYSADVQVLMMEASCGLQLYEPLRALMRLEDSIAFAEEAIANRRVWDWSKRAPVGIREFAQDFMKLQPDAYARFDESKGILAAEWAATVRDGARPGTAGRVDLAPWAFAAPEDLRRRTLCPEWVIRVPSLSAIFPPTFNLPPVSDVVDGEAVEKALAGRLSGLRPNWDRTKKRLIENRHRPGLDFKRWTKGGPDVYS